MEVTFHNDINPNVILWNSSSDKRLCKFVNGICKTGDKEVIKKLITLKDVKYDKKEYESFLKFSRTKETAKETSKETSKVENTEKKHLMKKGDTNEF